MRHAARNRIRCSTRGGLSVPAVVRGGRRQSVRQLNERAPIQPKGPHENAFWLCLPKAGRRELEDVHGHHDPW